MKNFLLIILIILPNYLSAKSKCSEKLCLDLNIVNKSLFVLLSIVAFSKLPILISNPPFGK